MRFHKISWISTNFKGRGFGAAVERSPAPKESFTRFQLAAFSLIFMDF